MPILRWRVHFTRRDLRRPREVTPLMEEFADLFGRLDARVHESAVPEGQPYLIGPRGEFDVGLNRYFSTWLAPSPWNTRPRFAYVRRLPVVFAG
jgi:NAD(P)-dependent dehydrogenase (short-subunit alcohol dehydrogenase family)